MKILKMTSKSVLYDYNQEKTQHAMKNISESQYKTMHEI